MSEKRFIFYEYDDGTETIEDTEENEYYHFSNELVGLLNTMSDEIEEVVHKLNEQQATINELRKKLKKYEDKEFERTQMRGW